MKDIYYMLPGTEREPCRVMVRGLGPVETTKAKRYAWQQWLRSPAGRAWLDNSRIKEAQFRGLSGLENP